MTQSTSCRGVPGEDGLCVACGRDEDAHRSRSEVGGWGGHGYPEHGDFVRPRPSGNAHIAERVTPYNSRHARVELACGAAWSTAVLDPSDGDRPRQCQRCWDSVGWSLTTESRGASGAPPVERSLPDRLSLTRRAQIPCGCIRAVDRVSGLAVIDSKECRRG